MTREVSKETISEFLALFERVDNEKPTQKDITALRSMMGDHPGLLEVMGGLARHNMLSLLDHTKMTEGARELFHADIKKLKAALDYEASPMLEKMLIDSLLLAWLRLNFYEHQMTKLDSQGVSLEKASFWEKRLSASQGRYLRACRTLAQVRRLARNIPSLQVNINTDSGQQVNFAGDLVNSVPITKGDQSNG